MKNDPLKNVLGETEKKPDVSGIAVRFAGDAAKTVRKNIHFHSTTQEMF